MEIKRVGVWELWLGETVLLLLVWSINDYAGTLLSASLAVIFLSVWLLSVVVEKIEKSKVPRWYFTLIFGAGIVALLVFLIFWWVKGGDFDWLRWPI